MEARSYKIPLGFQATLRVKMLPSIVLRPQPLSSSVVIDALAQELPLELSCDNVRSAVACSLTWLFLRDGTETAEPLRITHPSLVFLVASGVGRLENVRLALKADGDGRTPLKVDVMALGLYGTGKLGYELTPLWPEATTVTLTPASSNLRVEMEARLELLDLVNRSLGSTSDFLIGRQYRVRAKFAPAFLNQYVQLKIREIESEGGLPQIIEFQVGNPMWVSQLVAGFNNGQFDYRSTESGSDAKLRYVYSFRFLKKNARGDLEINKNAAAVAEQPLFTLPKPQLAAFSASSELPAGADPIRRIEFQGKFDKMENTSWDAEGRDLGFTFHVNVTVFARYFDEPAVSKPPTIRPLGKPVTVPVKRGSFSGYVTMDILDPEEWKRLEAQENSDLSFFLVLSLHASNGTRAVKKKGTTGEPQPLVFFEIADYDGNPQHHGMPAIERDKLTFKYWGTGVCSNLVGVHDQIAEFQGEAIDNEMEALALAMCIWTEANDNRDPAARALEMRHVGGVIINRRDSRYRDNTSILAVVLDPGQFSHFETTNPEKQALMSSSPAQVWQWSARLGAGRTRFEECVAIARELLDQPERNPWHDRQTVRHYYSPRSMRPPDSKPAWYDASKEELVSNIDNGRFRWFRNIL
jgi:Cell Wall Hydrolase